MTKILKSMSVAALCTGLVIVAACDNKSDPAKKDPNAEKPGLADILNGNYGGKRKSEDTYSALQAGIGQMADALGDAGMSAAREEKPAAQYEQLPHADKSTPPEQYKPLESGNQLMFSYYALGNLPVNYPAVMETYSRDYQREHDEFKKNDILEALKPKVDAEVARAKAERYFVFEAEANLEKYDFETKSFPMPRRIASPTVTNSFSDNREFNLSFTNGVRFSALKPASEDSARKIEALRSKNSEMHFIIYLYTQGIDPSNKSVQAEIVKVVLTDKRGSQLAVQE